ncbi:MAG: hypothetical protein FJZ61_03675 [Chlamydiae bacterium]|nr:hypothetical protein [Chlamydiota bacterium]
MTSTKNKKSPVPPLFFSDSSITATGWKKTLLIQESLKEEIVKVQNVASVLYDRVKEEPSPSVKIAHENLFYSFLGKRKIPSLPGRLDPQAQKKVCIFMSSFFAKAYAEAFSQKDIETFGTQISEWTAFIFRVEQNLPYLYFSEDPATRGRQYQEILNYFLLAIEGLQKHSKQPDEESRVLSLLILEDIGKCRPGVLSRIQHNILPLCFKIQPSAVLPLFPLSVVHRIKEMIAQRVLEEITDGNIDVHVRTGFYQFLHQKEGLGLTAEEHLEPESHCTSFLRWGRAGDSKDCFPVIESTKKKYLSIEHLIKEIKSAFKALIDDERDHLIDQELLNCTGWYIQSVRQLYASIVKAYELTLKSPDPVGLKERLQYSLQDLFTTFRIETLPKEDDFVKTVTKNLLRELLFDTQNGELSDFGALLLLKAGGIITSGSGVGIQTELLDCINPIPKLRFLLKEQHENGQIQEEQIPSQIVPPTIELIRKSPSSILQMGRVEALEFLSHLDELSALCPKKTPPFDGDNYATWPQILKLNKNLVLDHLLKMKEEELDYTFIDPLIVTKEFILELDEKRLSLAHQKAIWSIIPAPFFEDFSFVLKLAKKPHKLEYAPDWIKNNSLILNLWESRSLVAKGVVANIKKKGLRHKTVQMTSAIFKRIPSRALGLILVGTGVIFSARILLKKEPALIAQPVQACYKIWNLFFKNVFNGYVKHLGWESKK